MDGLDTLTQVSLPELSFFSLTSAINSPNPSLNAHGVRNNFRTASEALDDPLNTPVNNTLEANFNFSTVLDINQESMTLPGNNLYSLLCGLQASVYSSCVM